MSDEQFVKKWVVGAIILALFVLAFFILRPIILTLTLGVMFAYIFNPVYKWILKRVKWPNTVAFLLLLVIALLIFVPLAYFTPTIINQTFETYVLLQNLDMVKIAGSFMGEEIAKSVAANIDNLVGKIFSGFLNQFTEFLVDLPSILLQFAVFLFTAFFVMRDSDKIKDYLIKLSPFSLSTEKKFISELMGITNAIIYGQVLIGILQGLALGAGLFFLGVPKALTLTLVACIASIIPVLGSWIVWLPVGVFLLVSGDSFSAMFILIYGAVFVSSIDNFIRPYLLSRGSNLPLALSVIGTIGGLYFFGILGLVFGPLVIAYVLIIIEFYREGKLNELFKK